jgi:hypothetical protein
MLAAYGQTYEIRFHKELSMGLTPMRLGEDGFLTLVFRKLLGFGVGRHGENKD